MNNQHLFDLEFQLQEHSRVHRSKFRDLSRKFNHNTVNRDEDNDMKLDGGPKFHSSFSDSFYRIPSYESPTISQLPFLTIHDRSHHDDWSRPTDSLSRRSNPNGIYRPLPTSQIMLDHFGCEGFTSPRRGNNERGTGGAKLLPSNQSSGIVRTIPIQVIREPRRERCEVQIQPPIPRFVDVDTYCSDDNDYDDVCIVDNSNGNSVHNLKKGRPAKRRPTPANVRTSQTRGASRSGQVTQRGRVDSHQDRARPIETSGFPPVLELDDSLTECFRSHSSSGAANSKKKVQITPPMKCDIQSTPGYTIYAYLKSKLESDNRQIDYIQGDGNCFFRALSKEVYGQESFHAEVRQAVVDVIDKYPKEFEQFLDRGETLKQHTHEMRLLSTWSTTMEIYAAATLLQRDIYVLSPDHTGDSYNWLLFSSRFGYSGQMSYHPCYITLCHTNGNHYDRIAAKNTECNCGLRKPNLIGVDAYVDLTNVELCVC